jgi:hypothetical protein
VRKGRSGRPIRKVSGQKTGFDGFDGKNDVLFDGPEKLGIPRKMG